MAARCSAGGRRYGVSAGHWPIAAAQRARLARWQAAASARYAARVAELCAQDLSALERLYAGPLGEIPAGCRRGRFLGFVDSPGGRALRHRAVHTILFRWPRFGIDLDRRRWWFVDPRVGAGSFRTSIGPSRWRDTEVVRLEYDVSRLPGPIRGLLYDELKPLPDGQILGLGGIAAPRGAGDHFFFALDPA
jgi:hypothetical protein